MSPRLWSVVIVVGMGVYLVEFCAGAPTVPSTCTPRCSDTSSDGYWSCYDNVCNTWEIGTQGQRTCHYHMFFADEIGQCLHNSGRDIVILGGSWLLGAFINMATWHDPTTQSLSYLNFIQWLGTVGSDGTDNLGQLAAAEIFINQQGQITHKAGRASSSILGNSGLTDLVSASPSSGDTKITFAYLRYVDLIQTAVSQLAAAGRITQNTVLVVTAGMWDYYCANGVTSACENQYKLQNYNNWDAIFSSYSGALTSFGQWLHSNFPNNQIYFTDYSTWDSRIIQINNAIQTVAAANGFRYINVHGMLNHDALEACGHPVNVVETWVYQRLLSQLCVSSGSECAEIAEGSSGCQSPASAPHWYTAYTIPCRFTSYWTTVSSGTLSSGSSSVTVTATSADGIQTIKSPSSVSPGSTVSVTVTFQLAATRYITVDFMHQGDWQWYGGNRITASTSGTQAISVSLASSIPTGSGFTFVVHIIPLGESQPKVSQLSSAVSVVSHRSLRS